MRTALLFQDGNFVGREYFRGLAAAGVKPDLLIAAGRMSEASVAHERLRTGGRWNPPALPSDEQVHRFESMRDGALWDLLRARGIDLALQGGIGILSAEMLAVPRFGFLNVHPGRLPGYRGRMCPERAILNGEPVFASAHLIDAGIDTGPIVLEREIPVDFGSSYEDFRAGLYAHCAAALAEAIQRLAACPEPLAVARPQAAEGARYWPALTDDELDQVKAKFRGR